MFMKRSPRDRKRWFPSLTRPVADDAGSRSGARARGAARASGLVLGGFADGVVPDPARGHPVAVFGTVAAACERRFWVDARAAGAAYAVTGLVAAVGLGWCVDRLTRRSRAGMVAVTAVCAWAVLGRGSLAREASAMRGALEADDLPAARGRLSHLCGRDPTRLSAEELCRATIESVAENTADAVVAPLLWGAVAGPAGLLGYRAVNTLDAMVGYRGDRYGRFGWAAARLDDVATWLPARVTAALMMIAAPLVGGHVRETWSVLVRDGSRHPSPNAGRCEAAAAGALGVRLGGVNRYDHGVEHRPELGHGPPPQPGDIDRALRLAHVVDAAAAATAVGIALGSPGQGRSV